MQSPVSSCRHWRHRALASKLAMCVLCLFSIGCRPSSESGGDANDSATGTTLSAKSEVAIVSFCGDCHAMPDPGSFPKHAWRAEVQRGYDFYYASGRSDLDVPIRGETLEYFVSRAPTKLAVPSVAEIDSSFASRFSESTISIPGVDDAAISFVEVVDAGEGFGTTLLFSDMRGGGVYLAKVAEGQIAEPLLIGKVSNPAAARITDWDSDGWLDVIVADLGSFLPEDNDRGQVVLMRRVPDTEHFESQVLVGKLGRVATIEIADFDGDELNDVLIGEFGWHDTGRILLARRVSADSNEPLKLQELDPRPGVIHLPVVDWNQDGYPDFIALISQHFESIELFLNDGKGNFTANPIYRAPDPSFGSSGISLVDLDRDGDTDILYTNGDAFDSFILKPFHGVRWFENNGTGEFAEHFLGQLPGAHRALAGDVTGDGQLEIVTGAFLPRDLLQSEDYQHAEAVGIWTRGKDGTYQRHPIRDTEAHHAAIALHDINRDGRQDIVLASFREAATSGGPAFTVLMTHADATSVE